MSITIINPGLLTSVQDFGQIGYQETGFSQTGVMDQKAMKLANILVSNNIEEAVLEMTYFGTTIIFHEANVISITGGDFKPKLNGQMVPMYAAMEVKAGDKLECGFAINGCRGYISFAGGLNIEKVLECKSTNLKCGIGGFQGRKLLANDTITFTAPKQSLPNIHNRIIAKKQQMEKEYLVRVILGPQEEYFTEAGLHTFLTEPYEVTSESDRMGCKLSGRSVSYKDKVDIVSDGIPFGGIQIPPNGKPIIMLADRQTTGGYAKIATIIFVDLPIIAQRKPGEIIRFKAVTLKEAQKLYKRELKEIKRLEKSMGY